jgi:uncharacterized membrane protein
VERNEQIKQRTKINDITLNGMLIAIVFVSTYFIQIKLPISVNGGLIHLGNVALFSIAILFGPKKGAMAGAFGMCLFDLMSGWVAWAPFTFAVRGIMGFIIGYIAHKNGKKGNSLINNVFGIILGGLWMIAGYYATEGLLYGNWIAPITSIPGNITQIALGIMVGVPFAAAVKKTNII